MKLHPLQSSFESGELSPRMLGRTETDQYKRGLSACLNMIVDARGPVRSRAGTEFNLIGNRSLGQVIALEVFQITVDLYFNMYFGDQWLRIYDLDGNVKADFITAPWLGTEVADVFIVEEPSGLGLFLLHPNHPPWFVTYNPTTTILLGNAVSFASTPAEWVAGSYPSCGAIFQGRLWLGGTNNEPATFWGSKSGDYTNFGVSAPVVPDDALLAISMERFGRIQWMEGTKNLVFGCTTGEYLIVADSGLLQPGDINIERQSAYGSAHIQAVQVNERLFYVSGDGRKVRSMYFEFATNNWVSDDILFLSEHLSQPIITDIRWAPNPDNLLWVLLADGTMISCTYERSNSIQGWHRHNTNGPIGSISVGELAGTSYLNLVVERVTGDVVFETMNPVNNAIPMDSYISKASVIPVAGIYTITGLDHLEGLEVQILADGAVKPVETVVGGAIEVTYDATEYLIGLGYSKYIKTLPIDIGSAEGSGISKTKRYSEIIIRMLDSAFPLINGMRPPDRTPATLMGLPEPPVTGDVSVHDLGYDQYAYVEVEQDLPLALTVVAIFGDLAQESF